jgi:hypothetical protein
VNQAHRLPTKRLYAILEIIGCSIIITPTDIFCFQGDPRKLKDITKNSGRRNNA